jgi:hypothetical protein
VLGSGGELRDGAVCFATPTHMLEEIGVPRAAFGRTKKAIIQPLWLTESLDEVLSPASYADFAEFVASVSVLDRLGERTRFRFLRLLYEANLRINWRLQSLGTALGVHVDERPLVPERYSRDRGRSSLTFHWGVERVLNRYRALAPE